MGELSFAERLAALPPLGVGLGFRAPLRACFRDSAAPIACAEVVAEHFFSPDAAPPARPEVLGDLPLLSHSLDLSLGTPGPLDERYLERLAAVARGLDAVLVSDHLALTRTAEVELGHLNPVPPTRRNLREIAAKIRAVQERCGLLFLLENVTTHLRIPAELPFPDFFCGIAREADCGLLLDVTNLYVNARNFGRDPYRALDALDLERVVQLHLVGFSEQEGRLFDTHVADIQPALFDFTEAVLERAPVRALIVERDGHYPPRERLYEQLERLTQLFVRYRQPAPS